MRVALLFALGGCAPAMDLGRATTLDPGEVRWSGGAELTALRADLRSDSSAPLPWAEFTTGVHAGVTDRLELGVRGWAFGVPDWLTTVGAAADAKVQVRRGVSGPDLALGASFSWQSPALGDQPWTALGLTVPLFVGFDVGTTQFVLSPRVAGWWFGGYGQRALLTPAVGGSVGWSFRHGNWEIMPEMAWMYAPVNWDGAVHAPERTGAHSFHTGVAFSRHSRPGAPRDSSPP